MVVPQVLYSTARRAEDSAPAANTITRGPAFTAEILESKV